MNDCFHSMGSNSNLCFSTSDDSKWRRTELKIYQRGSMDQTKSLKLWGFRARRGEVRREETTLWTWQEMRGPRGRFKHVHSNHINLLHSHFTTSDIYIARLVAVISSETKPSPAESCHCSPDSIRSCTTHFDWDNPFGSFDLSDHAKEPQNEHQAKFNPVMNQSGEQSKSSKAPTL